MRLPCYVIEDLLPSYVDGCLSRETAMLVKEHLETCDECRAVYEAMKAPVAQPSDVGEIDFLKKVRRQNLWKTVAVAVLLCLLIGGMICAKVFVIGSEAHGSATDDIRVEDGCVYATVELPEDQAFLRYEVSKEFDGSWKVRIYSAKESLFHQGNTGQLQIPLEGLTSYLYLGDHVITPDGRILDPVVVSLVDSRLNQRGNIWQVSRLLQRAEISLLSGNYTFHQQSGMQPYSLLVTFYDKEFFSQAEEEILELRGRMVLACMDLYNEIRFESASETFTVRSEETARTYEELERLMEQWK